MAFLADASTPIGDALGQRFVQPRTTIWLFWHDEAAMPPLVAACLESWKVHNPCHEVVLLTDANVEQYVSDWPEGCAADGTGFESIHKKSNWIRLSLLELRGGVWVDASSWCTAPIERWVSFDAFKATVWSARYNAEVYENWAIASPTPGLPVMAAWRAQVRRCHAMGRDEYIATAFATHFPELELRWAGKDADSRPVLPYLWCHLCLLVALILEPALESSLVALPAKEGPRWRSDHHEIKGEDRSGLGKYAHADRVASDCALGGLKPCDYAFLKLTNPERRSVDALLSAGAFGTGSVLADMAAIAGRLGITILPPEVDATAGVLETAPRREKSLSSKLVN